MCPEAVQSIETANIVFQDWNTQHLISDKELSQALLRIATASENSKRDQLRKAHTLDLLSLSLLLSLLVWSFIKVL
jgi:hypothetical protein